jgi:hypothetical protein
MAPITGSTQARCPSERAVDAASRIRISHLPAEFIAEDSVVVASGEREVGAKGNSRSCCPVHSAMGAALLIGSQQSGAVRFSFSMCDLAARVLSGHRNRQITTILAGALLCG